MDCEPKGCCCCASLRTGTQVIGWLGLIGSTLQLLSQLRYVFLSHQSLVLVCQHIIGRPNQEMDPEFCANNIRGVTVSGTVHGGISLLVCILLLIGVRQNKPNMMFPYLIFNGIGIVLLAILTVLMFFFFAFNVSIGGVFVTVYVFGGILSLVIYLFLVVQACQKEVQQHIFAMGSNSNIANVEQIGECTITRNNL